MELEFKKFKNQLELAFIFYKNSMSYGNTNWAWMAARGGGVRRKAPCMAQTNLKSWGVKWSWGVIFKGI